MSDSDLSNVPIEQENVINKSVVKALEILYSRIYDLMISSAVDNNFIITIIMVFGSTKCRR